jgi:hypothetical protein
MLAAAGETSDRGRTGAKQLGEEPVVFATEQQSRDNASAQRTQAKERGPGTAGQSREWRKAISAQRQGVVSTTATSQTKEIALPSHKDFLSGLRDVASKLQDGPLGKIEGALGRALDVPADQVQGRLDQLEKDSGLAKTASGARETRTTRGGSHKGVVDLGPAGSLTHASDVKATAGAKARGRAKVGVAGANVAGLVAADAGASAGTRGQLKGDVGTLDYAARAEAGARAHAKGSAKLDAKGLKAHADVGGTARVGVDGRAALKTDVVEGNLAGKAEAKVFAHGRADATVDSKGLRADVSGRAGAEARAEVNADFRTTGVTLGGERVDINGRAKGYVTAGATAEGRIKADATISPPRLNADVGGKAFAGVKAGVRGEIGVGGFIKAKGHAEAWAGAGAEGGLKLGYDDGKLRIGLGGGAAAGYGVGVGGSVEIDVKKMANIAASVVTNPLAAVGQLGRLGTDLTKSARGVATTMQKTAQSARDIVTGSLRRSSP